jgi:hypothetical protein
MNVRAAALGLGWLLLAGGASVLRAEGGPEAVATNIVAAARPGDSPLACATWVYAGSKSAVCFSPKFLGEVAEQTNVQAEPRFTPVPLADKAVFE